jgi:hypothetical protein
LRAAVGVIYLPEAGPFFVAATDLLIGVWVCLWQADHAVASMLRPLVLRSLSRVSEIVASADPRAQALAIGQFVLIPLDDAAVEDDGA